MAERLNNNKHGAIVKILTTLQAHWKIAAPVHPTTLTSAHLQSKRPPGLSHRLGLGLTSCYSITAAWRLSSPRAVCPTPLPGSLLHGVPSRTLSLDVTLILKVPPILKRPSFLEGVLGGR